MISGAWTVSVAQMAAQLLKTAPAVTWKKVLAEGMDFEGEGLRGLECWTRKVRVH